MRRRLRLLREQRHELGLPYALLNAAREAVDRLLEPLDGVLLRIEGRRGVLGPAHRRYRGQTALDNRELWSGYDWSGGGLEWGPVESRDALIEKLLPAEHSSIVEIGPGAGRFSEALADRAERLVLVDVTAEALARCRQRLGDGQGVEYVRTDGASLPGVESGSADLVWSFEAFVHMQPVDVGAYVGEIARVLGPGGVAVIHHSGRRDRSGWRAPMSAPLFARLARDRGLDVVSQETWGTYDDVISVLRRAG
jgi:SAM-dependent methyltransferase